MKLSRVFAGFAAGVFLAVTFAGTAMAGHWWRDNGRWWYEGSDGGYYGGGMYTIDGVQYIFDNDGYLVEDDWMEMADGGWYYCLSDGRVAKDQWAGNYYLGSNGRMLTDAWTPDGYYVGSDGEWIPGYESYRKDNSQLEYSGAASSHITSGWIYGYYENTDQAGFNNHHCVQMHVNYDNDFGSDAMFYFSIYDLGGNNYDLYDSWDPSGDVLYGYYLGQGSAYLRSALTGDTYRMTYNGKSTIKIYWRNTSWLESGDNCITLKKITEYYPDAAYTISVTDDEDEYTDTGSSSGNNPFVDREYNITKNSGESYDNSSDELETKDISHYNW